MARAERTLLKRPERQEAILRGAASAFARSGYAATSMDDVAAASGITKLIVYRHFESKEDLYRAVLQRVSTRMAEEFLAGLDRADRRGIAVRALLTVAREDRDGFVLLWRHASREHDFADYVAEFRAGAKRAALGVVAPSMGDWADWAADTVVDYLVDAVLNWLDAGRSDEDEAFVAVVTGGLHAMHRAWAAGRA